jgi:hypothetical protein
MDRLSCASRGARVTQRLGVATSRPLYRNGTRIQSSGTTKTFLTDRSDLVEFLREDLTHLFDDRGIDVTKYDNVVTFRDPITSYGTIQGYVANIKFLKNIFQPRFTLHDIKQTGDDEISFRWTMDMLLAGVHRELVFTGTSKLGVNEDTGRFCSHIDTWDAIQNQEYFSLEAFVHMLGQLFVERTEALEGEVLLKRKAYEVIRRRDGDVVAVFPGSHGKDGTWKELLDRDRLCADGTRLDALGAVRIRNFELPAL